MFLTLFISWNRGKEKFAPHTENTLIGTLAPLVLEVDRYKCPSLGQVQKIGKGYN